MNWELLQDYLLKTGMNEPQAEALSRVLAHVATKDDLLVLESSVMAKLEVLENKVDSKIESLKVDLTWRIIGSLALLATLMTLLDAFID